MTHKSDALIDHQSADESATSGKPATAGKPATNGKPASASGAEQDGLPTPGALERKHHELLERQGRGADDPELISEASALVAQARPLGTTLEDPKVRHHWQSVLDYWALFVYRMTQHELDADLFAFDWSLAPALRDDQFPYRFEDGGEHAQQMLGWRRLLDECERDLAGDRLLCVVSDNGSGTRLLVHNLLLPILRSGQARLKVLAGSDRWRYYVVPLGKTPVRDLLGAIAAQDGHDQPWIDQRESELRDDPAALSRTLCSQSQSPALLLFRRFGSLLQAPESDRAAIVQNLSHLLQDRQQRFYAIATLRRGQTIALAKFGPLEKPLRDGHVLMAFTTAELRHLIQEPARQVGLMFEPGLIDQILIDIQGDPTALPLLRFTLKRLWDQREKNRITWEGYRKTGGGRMALRAAMDAVNDNLSAAQQATLRQVLLAMVNLEPDGSFATCQVTREDLQRIGGGAAQVDEILERLQHEDLVRQNLPDERATFGLTYAAILTAWPPLVGWLDELRVRRRFALRLKQAATLWNDRSRSKDLLWQGPMLIEAEREFAADPSLTTPELDFLRAGRRREFAKQAMRFAAVFLIAALIIGALLNVRRAERHERLSGLAAKSLREGDAAAALLWIDARDGLSSWIPGPTSEAGQKLRQLASLQLPELKITEVLGEKTKGAEDTQAFSDLAVSTDQNYLALIHRDSASDSSEEKHTFTIEVNSLATGAKELPPLLVSKPIAGRGTGSVAWIPVPSGTAGKTDEYLLAAVGQLHAWRREPGGAYQPQPIDMQPLQSADPLTDLVAIAANQQSMVLSIQQRAGKARRRLRLWQLQTGASNDSLALVELPEPEQLASKSVQTACLSDTNDLLVICGEATDSANELMVFKHHGEHRWKLAKPPAWVAKMARFSKQRLYDWGWTLSPGGNWQRNHSFVRTVCFAPQSQQFATACDDGQVLTWSLNEEEQVADQPRPEASSRTFSVSPKFETKLDLGSSVFAVTFLNEGVLITGGRDRTARIWDIHAAAEIAPPAHHEGTVTKVAFAGPNKLITSTRRILRTWRSQDYRWIESPLAASQIAISGDGNRLLFTPEVASETLETLLKQRFPSEFEAALLSDQKIELAVLNHRGNYAFTVSRADQPLAGADPSATEQSRRFVTALRSWSAVGEPLTRLPSLTLAELPQVAFAASGDRLAVIGQRPGQPLSLLLCQSEPSDHGAQSTQWEEHPLVDSKTELKNTASNIKNVSIQTLTFGQFANQEILAMVGQAEDGSDTKHGIVLLGIPDDPQSTRLQLYHLMLPGKDAAAETGPATEASPTPEVSSPAQFPHQESALCVSFSPSGDLLAIGDAHDHVKVWNAKQLLEEVQNGSNGTISVDPAFEQEHSSDVVGVCFAPDTPGRPPLLATVTSEGEASVWSINHADKQLRLKYKLQHEAKIRTISFSPDGRWIITGGNDRAARVWHSDAGELVGMLRTAGPVVQARILQHGQIMTISQSSLITQMGDREAPLKQARLWTAASVPQNNPTELKRIAARLVEDDARLDPLPHDDFRPQ